MSNKPYPYPILVVDDESAILDVMSVNLERRNYSVHTAGTGREALLKTGENSYSVIILDYNLPDMDGFKILSELKKHDPDIMVIMITAYGTIEMAVEAMKSGAFNYLVKPINYDEMGLVVDKAIQHHKLLTELLDLRKQLDEKYELGSMVGQSRKMQKVYEMVRVVADSDATVLIRGETGTGKELIARAIHRHSTRHKKNFVSLNCAAIPSTLLEAELFGYEKGAFTGAVTQKPGKFERADEGTLFLDEIGEIPPEMQVKLLRTLQEGEFDRMGGTKTLKVDVRIIATTNRDLEKAMRDGGFRSDLFYRLNVIPIMLPPLRERKEDIPLLVNHFIDKFSKKNNKEIKSISPSALSSLMQYHWPGNVRELENVIERTVVLTAKDRISDVEVPISGTNGHFLEISGNDMSFRSSKKKVIESFEIYYLTEAMKHNKGNISAAAKKAGLDYKNFHSKLKKYNIKKRQFEDL
jgi:DNA-binding NtrC family response regulator